jgi:hypothetical protein
MTRWPTAMRHPSERARESFGMIMEFGSRRAAAVRGDHARPDGKSRHVMKAARIPARTGLHQGVQGRHQPRVRRRQGLPAAPGLPHALGIYPPSPMARPFQLSDAGPNRVSRQPCRRRDSRHAAKPSCSASTAAHSRRRHSSSHGASRRYLALISRASNARTSYTYRARPKTRSYYFCAAPNDRESLLVQSTCRTCGALRHRGAPGPRDEWLLGPCYLARHTELEEKRHQRLSPRAPPACAPSPCPPGPTSATPDPPGAAGTAFERLWWDW